MGGVRIALSIVLLSALSLGAEKIRIASYNFENYLVMDRIVRGKWKPNYPKPTKEKRALRTLVNLVRPDVLVIQEIGDRPFLNEFWQDLNVTTGTPFHHSAWMPGATEEEERHLAILSRIPFSQIRIHHDLSFTYFDGLERPSRGMLEAEFVVNGIRWNLFNLHLKSKWTERKDDPNANLRREKEARTIRDYLRKRFLPGEGHPYLLAGDFNDHKNSAPLRRFLQVNDLALTKMVPCVDSNGHFWTHYYAKQDSYSRLDYLLASPSFFKRLVPESAAIADRHFSLWASDHRMIYADFEF